jgi:hypothetical protein
MNVPFSCLFLSGVVLSLTAAQAADELKPQQPETSVKVEVRGWLSVTSEFRFPGAARRNPLAASAATISANPYQYELQVRDRRQFDLIKAGHGKLAVVTGRLEAVVVPQGVEPHSSPPTPKPPVILSILHVETVELVKR